MELHNLVEATRASDQFFFQKWLDKKAQILYRNTMGICVSKRISGLDYAKVVKKIIGQYYGKSACVLHENLLYLELKDLEMFTLFIH